MRVALALRSASLLDDGLQLLLERGELGVQRREVGGLGGAVHALLDLALAGRRGAGRAGRPRS